MIKLIDTIHTTQYSGYIQIIKEFKDGSKKKYIQKRRVGNISFYQRIEDHKYIKVEIPANDILEIASFIKRENEMIVEEQEESDNSQDHEQREE